MVNNLLSQRQNTLNMVKKNLGYYDSKQVVDLEERLNAYKTFCSSLKLREPTVRRYYQAVKGFITSIEKKD